MGSLQFNEAPPDDIRRNDLPVHRMYLGEEMVWDQVTTEPGMIDPEHMLANRTTLTRLTLGQLEGMTADANYAVVDTAFASATAGTLSLLKEPLPATSPTTLRISALIKVDKTAGRFSRVAYAFASSPVSNTQDNYIGHNAGTGIVVGSNGAFGGGISIAHTVIPESALVNGAWYRVSLVWDSVFHQNPATGNAGRNRVQGTAEPVDPVNTPADPWHVVSFNSRTDPANVPLSITARTNSALGTVRDLAYVDSMLGISGDDAPIHFSAESDAALSSEKMWLWSKAKAAPLRVIVTAGGSGLFGGSSWAAGLGQNGQPYNQWRRTWRELADLGYTLMHTQALHEGWGADDHLTKQLDSLNRLKAQFGSDLHVYYLGYSMGGLSAWRAIMGRAGYPPIEAAYIVAGAIGLERYYDTPSLAEIRTRWPDPELLDAPEHFTGADLIATGTRVRLVTSTGDTNVPKVDNHDTMKAKYGASPLFSELVHSGIGHFDPLYWDSSDMATFFDGVP